MDDIANRYRRGLVVWLDDRRPMREGYQLHCRTGESLLELFRHDAVAFCSFDNDLGPGIEGIDVIDQVERWVHDGVIAKPVRFQVHTGNSVAGLRMCGVINDRIYPHWEVDWLCRYQPDLA
jgi:hypothetical protein